MEIENLLKQRELLDAQITDVKTREIRQTIEELQANSRILLQKLQDAKAKKKTSDADISAQIKSHYAEIEKLKNISFSEIYFVSQIQNQINENASQLAENQKKLREMLADENEEKFLIVATK